MKRTLKHKPTGKTRQTCYRLCLPAFILYLGLLIYVLLFKADPHFAPLNYTQAYQASFQQPSNYNLLPFQTIKSYWSTYRATGNRSALFNLLGNALALMPYGILVPVLSRRRKTFLLTFLSGACLILLIEGIQLVTVWGILDIDDLILNLSGLVMGWFIYWLFARLFHSNKF